MQNRKVAILGGNKKSPTADINIVTAGALDPRFTFLRASTGSYADGTGVWQQVAANVPRVSTAGLLLEETRTNSIRNPRGLNAVIGGALPTYWTQSQTTGLSLAVTGSGVENGVWYLETRLNGTTSTGTNNTLFFESTVAASASQVWTSSLFLKLQAGSLTNITSFQLIINDNIANGQAAITNPTGAVLGSYRPTLTRTLNSGSVTGITGVGLQIVPVASSAIDLTIRIGLPQLELGAWITNPIF